MSLQFGVDIPLVKDIDQPFSRSLRFLCVLRVSVVIYYVSSKIARRSEGISPIED